MAIDLICGVSKEREKFENYLKRYGKSIDVVGQPVRV
jgi:hypothetical protein